MPNPIPLRTRAAIVVGLSVGIAILVMVWHAASLRLELEGANLAWPALAALGVAWGTPRKDAWRSTLAVVLGAVVSVIAFYLSLRELPVTPLGIGLGVGFAATVIVAIVLRTRVLSLGPLAVGYGVGLAAGQLAELGPTTGAADFVALLSAVTLALLIGALAARLLEVIAHATQGDARTTNEGDVEQIEPRILPGLRRRRAALPAPEEDETIVIDIDEDVLGPVLESPSRMGARSSL